MGATGGTCPPKSHSRQNFSKKNGIKLVGYTLKLKIYVKIPPFLSDFSELAPPLAPYLSGIVHVFWCLVPFQFVLYIFHIGHNFSYLYYL